MRCVKASDDNGTTTTCICTTGDRVYHDTDCDQTKDSGEEFIDFTGDVTGPSSSTDNAFARFNGTTGKIIQDYTSGAPTSSDAGAVTIPVSLTIGDNTNKDLRGTWDLLAADQILGWNEQFCGTLSKTSTFGNCPQSGAGTLKGFDISEMLVFGLHGATCSVAGTPCEVSGDCPGAEKCSGGTAADTRYMLAAHDPTTAKGSMMHWQAVDQTDGFELYTFGGGVLGFQENASTFDLQVRDSVGILRTHINVNGVGTMALGFTGNTTFFNGKFNSLGGGIMVVSGTQKLEIEGTPVTEDFTVWQETTDASDTVAGVSLASANNACFDLWDGAIVPAKDISMCRNGANRLDLAGGNLFTDDSIYILEQADADADSAGYGQVWINTATPNELWWTNDTGTDTRLGYTTDTDCLYLEDPTAADDLESIGANKTATDWTITEIWAESDQTVTFMLQIDDGSPADVDSVDLSPAAGEAEDTALNGDTTLGAGEELDLDLVSVSGTPTWVSICWTYTKLG